jgi:hypothetical protein
MDRGERHRITELLESANMVPLNASGIQLVKVVPSEICVGLLLPQDVIQDDQQTVVVKSVNVERFSARSMRNRREG